MGIIMWLISLRDKALAAHPFIYSSKIIQVLSRQAAFPVFLMIPSSETKWPDGSTPTGYTKT